MRSIPGIELTFEGEIPHLRPLPLAKGEARAPRRTLNTYPVSVLAMLTPNKRRPELVLIRYRITAMKLKIGILMAVLAAMAPIANAIVVNVEVGDRPYYIHGPGYYVGRVYWVWIPGHWGWRHHHRVWIHGHYARAKSAHSLTWARRSHNDRPRVPSAGA
jgi:hypothetical protein